MQQHQPAKYTASSDEEQEAPNDSSKSYGGYGGSDGMYGGVPGGNIAGYDGGSQPSLPPPSSGYGQGYDFSALKAAAPAFNEERRGAGGENHDSERPHPPGMGMSPAKPWQGDNQNQNPFNADDYWLVVVN